MPIYLKSRVVFAQPEDLFQIKVLADAHRQELGFVDRATLAHAIAHQEVLYVPHGFLHFHHRRDNISTLYHFCVSREYRRLWIARQLIEAWEKHSRSQGIQTLRLKCPLNLEANGFYLRNLALFEIVYHLAKTLRNWELVGIIVLCIILRLGWILWDAEMGQRLTLYTQQNTTLERVTAILDFLSFKSPVLE